jgi:protein phosphatase
MIGAEGRGAQPTQNGRHGPDPETGRGIPVVAAVEKREGRLVNWEDIIVDAAATDIGMRRMNNQDNFATVRALNPATWRQRGHLFMVADGMGAHAVGELAAKLACDNIPHSYSKAKNLSATDALVKAYKEVGSIINHKASANKEFQGMGTTCSTLVLLPEGALIAHVGDSRVYRVRGAKIEQLSFDHSLVWELVRRNHLSLEAAQKAVPRNVITRSLGPDPTIEVDIEGPHVVEHGDVFVLCSDGLSGPVPDPEIGALAANFHPEDATRYLVHLANLRGGMDNITTIVVRIGPWVEPGTGEQDQINDAAKKKTREPSGFRLANLLTLGRRAPQTVVETHVYQSAECPIDEPLLHFLTETVRRARAHAIEQGWTVDWSILANLQREAEEAREENELRGALRCLCEGIHLLGVAARTHRKASSGNGGNAPAP